MGAVQRPCVLPQRCEPRGPCAGLSCGDRSPRSGCPAGLPAQLSLPVCRGGSWLLAQDKVFLCLWGRNGWIFPSTVCNFTWWRCTAAPGESRLHPELAAVVDVEMLVPEVLYRNPDSLGELASLWEQNHLSCHTLGNMNCVSGWGWVSGRERWRSRTPCRGHSVADGR